MTETKLVSVLLKVKQNFRVLASVNNAPEIDLLDFKRLSEIF